MEKTAADRPGEVVIEVLGGVAQVTQCPEGVSVRIIDHDNDNEQQEAWEWRRRTRRRAR